MEMTVRLVEMIYLFSHISARAASQTTTKQKSRKATKTLTRITTTKTVNETTVAAKGAVKLKGAYILTCIIPEDADFRFDSMIYEMLMISAEIDVKVSMANDTLDQFLGWLQENWYSQQDLFRYHQLWKETEGKLEAFLKWTKFEKDGEYVTPEEGREVINELRQRMDWTRDEMERLMRTMKGKPWKLLFEFEYKA